MDDHEHFSPDRPLAFFFVGGGWLRFSFGPADEHEAEARSRQVDEALAARVPYESPTVLAKTVERGGRRVITRLIVAAEPLDSAVVKMLPAGRIESIANMPWVREALARMDADPDPLTEAVGAALSMRAVVDMGSPPRQATRAPLRRPDGSDPDGFYSGVAEAYNEALERTSAPAPTLAAEAGVPVPTARRWIAEARRRGLLGPARKGRAG